MNYSTTEILSYNTQQQIFHQQFSKDVGTFDLMPPENSDQYENKATFELATFISQSKESKTELVKIRVGLKKLLDTFAINNDPKTREIQINYQGVLERWIEKIYIRPNDSNDIENLRKILFQLIKDSDGKLHSNQINAVYDLLTDINKINKPALDPRKENSDKESKKVEVASQEADVNFFDNVIVPNFFEFNSRTVKINTIRKFCFEDIKKCETYLSFLKRHRFEIEYSPNAQAKIKIVLDPLISYFQLAIQQQKLIYPRIN